MKKKCLQANQNKEIGSISKRSKELDLSPSVKTSWVRFPLLPLTFYKIII